MTQPAGEMPVVQYDSGWRDEWDDMKTLGPFSRHVRRLIRSVIAPLEFTSALDVGCGQGALLSELERAYPACELYGTDFSPVAVDLARRKVPRAGFQELDLVKQSMDRQFDLVICSEVLEHIEADVTAIRHLRQMTSRYLVVTVPQGRMRPFEIGSVGHVRNYQRGELQEKLRHTGLEPLRTIEWGFPLYSPLYRDYLNWTGGKGTTGRFGIVRRSAAAALYYAFLLNSWTRGDELVVLARAEGRS